MTRFLFSSCASLILLSTPGLAADLAVTMAGINDNKGMVGCALFDNAAAFPEAKGAIAIQGKPADPAGVTCLFPDLKPGTYAVVAMHDTNGNKKVDRSELGFPTEDWGASNNVRPTMRAPTFKEASFTVGTENVSIEINLAH